MKKVYKYLLILCSFLGYSQHIDVMTFNIRYDNPNDKENAWTKGNRKERVAKIIQNEKPTIFGVQEALYHQIEFLENKFPNYQRVGVGRDDGDKAGEFVAIFYDKNKYDLLDSGYFWLSETPEKPSLGWDATCCNRITTWVKLQYGKHILLVFNTHFDHEGKIAQRESANLILKKIEEIKGTSNDNVILMGDFNITPENEGIVSISREMRDTYQVYKKIPSGTFTAFYLVEKPKIRIDYIFISRKLQSERYRIIDKKIDKLFPSDHFPVKVRISFPK